MSSFTICTLSLGFAALILAAPEGTALHRLWVLVGGLVALGVGAGLDGIKEAILASKK